VRSQVLLGSVRVRDALLTADRQALDQDREQVETTYRIILMALADYEPLIGSTTAGKALTKLRAEVEQFHDSSMTVLVMAHGRSPAAIRDVLNQHIAPGRRPLIRSIMCAILAVAHYRSGLRAGSGEPSLL